MSAELRDPRLPKRFWRRVRVTESGCWEWTGTVIQSGYGQYGGSNRATRYVHRIAYEALVGAVPKGLQLDHLCRNRVCCNPAHLEPVTQRENILRGIGIAAQNAARTHCRRGHEFTAANTYIQADARSAERGRSCRACHALRESAKRRDARRAA